MGRSLSPPPPSTAPTSQQDPPASLQPFSLLETEIAKAIFSAVQDTSIMALREFCSVDLGLVDISLFLANGEFDEHFLPGNEYTRARLFCVRLNALECGIEILFVCVCFLRQV